MTTVKKYAPGRPLEFTRSRGAIQRAVSARAAEFADKRGFKGGSFEVTDYRKALAELSLTERQIERGFDPTASREPSQRQRASGHFAAEAKKFVKQGYPHDTAIKLAKHEEAQAPGFKAARAGFPVPGTEGIPGHVREESNRMAMFYNKQRLGDGVLKRYAAGGGAGQPNDEAKRRSLALVPVQIVADVLYHDLKQPDARHRNWADAVFGATTPPPVPVPGGGNRTALSDYNRARQDAVEAAMAEARDILLDPERLATIKPRPLGA